MSLIVAQILRVPPTTCLGEGCLRSRCPSPILHFFVVHEAPHGACLRRWPLLLYSSQARTPLPPPLVLVLEVTQPAITSLVTDTVLTALSAVLPTLPPHTRVALIAFNDAVHFFTPPLREESTGEGALRTFMIPDLDEMCLPLPPEQLLLPLSESRQGLLSLFDTVRLLPTLIDAPLSFVSVRFNSGYSPSSHPRCLPVQMKKRLFQGLRRPDSAFGAAVEAARLLLEPTGGRCLVFQHTLPGIGPLKLVRSASQNRRH